MSIQEQEAAEGELFSLLMLKKLVNMDFMYVYKLPKLLDVDCWICLLP